MITREQLIAMYAAYPGALEVEIKQVFAYAPSDEDRIKHNDAKGHIDRLFSTDASLPLLWKNVARAIIETALHEPTGATNGKDGQG